MIKFFEVDKLHIYEQGNCIFCKIESDLIEVVITYGASSGASLRDIRVLNRLCAPCVIALIPKTDQVNYPPLKRQACEE